MMGGGSCSCFDDHGEGRYPMVESYESTYDKYRESGWIRSITTKQRLNRRLEKSCKGRKKKKTTQLLARLDWAVPR